MPGGIMQLVAYGAEDLYLTGNPQITFFKTVYRRHTNFATEYIEQYYYTLPNFSTDQSTIVKLKIDRHADLMYDTYLVYDLPDVVSTPEENFRWTRNLGQNIIRTVEIEIGGQTIDKHYGLWLNVWTELTVSDSKRPAYDRMIGDIPKLRPGFGTYYPDKGDNVTIPRTRLYIPMEFWFCKNSGLALPLIALQYTEVWIYVEFNPLNDLFTIGKNNLSPCVFFSQNNGNTEEPDPLVAELESEGFDSHTVFFKFIPFDWNQNTFFLVNYVFLDRDERRKFAQSSHEYLIHQVQRRLFTGIFAGPNTVEVNDLFHPMKELIWIFRRADVSNMNDWNNYTFIDLGNDYVQLRKEYGNKYDILTNQADQSFLLGLNSFINDVEQQPSPLVFPNYLGCGTTRINSFNDFTNIMLNFKLIFNGHDRFDLRDNVFFNALQPYKYHTNSPPPGLYVYSFALKPEEEQPSGTANFSRLNKVEMQFYIRRDIDDEDTSDPPTRNATEYHMHLFGLNYNVLRIMGGIGGLAFNN